MNGWALLAAAALAGLPLSARRPARLRLAQVLPAAAGTDRRRAAVAGVAGALALAVALTVVVVVPVLVAGCCAFAARRVRAARLRSQREAACAELVFALAAELRAGRPAAQALEAAAGTAGVLGDDARVAAASVRSGATGAQALEALSSTPGCAALRGVAAAWAVSERVGGPVADVLDRLGEALDADAEVERTLQAALAGPRSTVVMLAALPALGLVLGQSVGAHPTALLLHRPLGWALLGGAAVFETAGLTWTRSLVGRALRR
jgi:tight adherence protein B